MNDLIKALFSMKYPAIIACLLFSSCFSINTYADEEHRISIAVVNVAYLMKKSPGAEEATRLLKERFSPREQALQAAREQIQKLEAERDKNKAFWSTEQLRQAERNIRALSRDRTRSLEDFREELRFARDTALDEVQKSVFKAIEEVRSQRKIDIVIQEYVAASQRVDLTPHVLDYLTKQLNAQQSEAKNKKKAE